MSCVHGAEGGASWRAVLALILRGLMILMLSGPLVGHLIKVPGQGWGSGQSHSTIQAQSPDTVRVTEVKDHTTVDQARAEDQFWPASGS